MRYADCHPDRKHKGQGLCNNCWQRSWRAGHPGQTWQDRNPDEAKEYQRQWYVANRARIAERRKQHRAEGRYKARDRGIYLAYKYGLSREKYRDHVVGQAGRCLICLRVPDRQLVVDHDHTTGQVRGLLCTPCNQGIGFMQDDPQRLVRAALYLGGAA